jgi:ABC-type glycerol-3-phosphate transport system substrate-binding protein
VSTPGDAGPADERTEEGATAPTARRGVRAWLRDQRARPVADETKQRLARPQGLFEGAALGLVIALLATTLPAALDDPDDLENGTVVVLSGRDDSMDGQRGKLVEQWNALHPDTQALIVELPEIADAQRSEMLARAQAGGGGVDVYNLDVTLTAEFAAAGHLQSLDESRVRTADFFPGPLSTCRYDGRLWALPFNSDVGLLYVNTDLLAKVQRTEPPSSWGRLVDDAEDIAGITNGATAGYVGQFADYEGLTVTAMEMVWGAEGVVVDDDGAVLPDPRDVGAVRTAFGRLKTVARTLPPTNEATSIEEFRDGRVLYMRNWPVADRTLRDPERKPPPPFRVATLPGGSAALGGQNLAVSATTDMPKASRALVEFLTDARSQQQLFQRGGLPATREVVYTDPAVQSEFTSTLLAALKGARARPVEPHYASFSRAFRAEVDAYVRGGQQVRDEDIRARLTASLQGREPSPP